MGGLIGGKGGSTTGGKKVPDVIANNTQPTSAYQISRTDFTIQFDPSGADADFIQKVPVKFSNNNGASYDSTPMDGWTYTKTSTSITFSNPNPTPPKALIKFDTDGTEYASGGGSYASELDLFEQCLQVWVCIKCSGTHGGGTTPESPLEHHQRLVWLELQNIPVQYYAALAGDPTMAGATGGITFQVFRHEEDFKSTYNLQMYKYDSETGKPLDGARFVLYERFDDQNQIDKDRDGAVHLYEGGDPYASYHKDSPVTWDGFRKAGTFVTDENGHASQTIEHGYHYDKTFCDGHPAPGFVEVPAPEEGEDEETGVPTGEILNADAIAAAQAENMALAQSWIDCVADCENQASGDFEGVHFHWVMSDVDEGAIGDIASSGGDEGSTPNGGNTAEPDADTAYEESGCFNDMKDTYDKFISLKYSYAATEFQAKDGYIRHDLHADDLPIEIITTDSSENGANAHFDGKYSNKEKLESNTDTYTTMTGALRAVEAETEMLREKPAVEPAVRKIPDALFQKARVFLQDIIPYETEEPGEVEKESQEAGEEKPITAEPEKPTAAESEKPITAEPEKLTAAEEERPTAAISSHILPLSKTAYSFEFIDEDKIEEEQSSKRKTRSVLNRATPSETVRSSGTASPSEAAFRWLGSDLNFRNPKSVSRSSSLKAADSALFEPAYEEALSGESSGDDAEPGDDGNYSHCNDADHEGNAWRIYDHRTEGEFHINKKDMDLASKESGQYNAYGDTQGDGTLEGAVYGLFAAEDITHPDGKTGTVYRTNNLVAIATTDKNGDASFLVNTEAPGYIYDYTAGSIKATADGWSTKAPKNLYTADQTFDDYTEDGQYERSYQDNENNNGNCWIGRPLLMGDYYVKELARSEGYELSIGNRKNGETNLGQDMDAQAPEAANGYAVVSSQVFADEQAGDDGDGAKRNEIFFSARSQDTKDRKYDIVLSNLPEGTEIYRKDVGTKEIQVPVGTGTYEKILLTNQDGSPKYITAEHDYQYPKYNADGSLMTAENPMNYVANRFRQVSVRQIDETSVLEVMNRADGTMTEAENTALLAGEFKEASLPYLKGKVESALRKNGKQTPRSEKGSGYDYSNIHVGVFDSGVREGDPDLYGLSGVIPGSPAAYTVYGSPVQRVSVKKQKSDGTALTVGDAILSVMNYYNSNPYYSYGGIDAVEDTGNSFTFTVYASVSGNPENFMVLGSDPENDSIIFRAVKYIPEAAAQPPRFIYAEYSNNSSHGAFGTYEDYKETASGTSVVATATLVTDAVADKDGNLKSKTVKENVYYKTGELVRDEKGNLIQAFEYREITKTETQTVEEVKWEKVPVTRQADGTCVVSVNADYTDAFGVSHTNSGTEQTIDFKAVLKKKTVTLTAEDAAAMGPGFSAGNQMNSASYYVHVKQARAKAYLDYLNTKLAGENTYISLISLVYPGQNILFQDAGTRDKPLQVMERAVRQKVKIVKDIQTTPEGTYAHNTNAESGHEDGFVENVGGTEAAATKLDNFRFKIYLKSNLERLYRDNDGTVAWLDRDGKEINVSDYQTSYPAIDPFSSVQKLYTKVQHKLDSKTTGSLNNNTWDSAVTVNSTLYSYKEDGLIEENQNPGYTRLLETIIETVEDGAGKTRQVEGYNYDKFFNALQTANHDKWDRQENSSTSFKPFSFIRGLIFGTGGGEKEDPAVHNNAETDNQANTSDVAKDNALRSDAVRQFAITWYLEDEVQKLQEKNGAGESQPVGGSERYQEEVYDRALQQAIIKAENYLKPFFAYDLDEIYAVAWDSDPDGGSDKDRTTLSADTLQNTTGNGAETSKDGYFYGVSKYLPYGAYVTVEQQPHNKELGDFYNKHYKTDKPKEIVLPAVYEPGGNEAYPESLNAAYEYHSTDTPENLQSKYYIRFNEEWSETHTDDSRKYVIRGHNTDGDFEVYKYGLEPDKLTGSITYAGGTYNYAGFNISQEETDPYKDIYEAENAASDYKANQTVEKYYRYGSVSEDAGVADNVLYQHGTATDDNNPSGMYFKDDVKTVTGALTAYDGLYAAALVPWTVTEPAAAAAYNPDQFTGYADGKFRNTFYTSKLRIEKLDSETGENILHDGAVFALYSASREDNKNSDGRVQFYNQDTVIKGSKEFLEAMGAREITPVAKAALPWEAPYLGMYYGTISAGTPICQEGEQIIMKDEQGAKTGQFKAFTTTGDSRILSEDGTESIYADQNVGYLTTPQPLGAGCYVLAEIKAPAGYVKSKPVAIEIYSDEVAYYLDGNKDSRVIAAIYEDKITKTADDGADIINQDGTKLNHTKPNGNKPQDTGDTARVYFNNTPIRLEVSKVKSPESEVSYELNGRLEGSITELKAEYGLENLELAYNDSGKYLNYGWKKGFLDALKQKQVAGERIEILYEDGVFTGKAILLKVPDTADDVNRYLPGAVMTLYDAVEVQLNGDSEDYKYNGVNVERDRNGNVKNISIQKGYAGTAIKYVLDKTNPAGIDEEDYKNYTYDQQEDDKGAGTWTYKTVEREDTDILFYDLGGLEVLTKDKGILYSHDRTGRKIQAKNGSPIFVLKNGTPFLEVICSDYENLKYSTKDRRFAKVPEGTNMYHLDRDGNRDSEVDPYTGMAFVVEEATGRILTWPVKISKDRYGNVIAREKIETSRIATIEADTEQEYTIGTYDSTSNSLKKSVNPVLNVHGQPAYYQRSIELYKKGRALYDRDGDYIRYKYSDSLKNFNDNAYRVDVNNALRDIGSNPETDTDDKPLYHRQGESYLIENTWTTGEKTPNDPFRTEMINGRTDVLKRIAAGTYIMEELEAPEGYVKTMPVGLTVNDSTEVQAARATDETINGYFEKLDAPLSYQIKVLDRDSALTENYSSIRTEGKGGYSFGNIEGAGLALYRAKSIATTDLIAHPSGYYLEKTEDKPASWRFFDNNNHAVMYTAEWRTKKIPEYLESIPKGFYILEETEAPSGFIRASVEIEIKEKEGLQYFSLPNDHTKLEIFKYTEENGRKVPLSNKDRAELALYEAVTDEDGIVTENGVPKYKADGEVDRWMTEDGSSYTGFIKQYEALYKEYGPGFSKIAWKNGEAEYRAELVLNEPTDKNESVKQIWRTTEGSRILVQVTKNLLSTGFYGFSYDYKLNYKKLEGNAVSYDTPQGNHRIDALALNGVNPTGEKEGYYVLVETKTPEGFAGIKPKPIVLTETPDIQLYSLKNEPKSLFIQKISEDHKAIKGAELALYKAASDGSLIMDETYLFDQWISDDLKPHYLSPVPYGIYYLVELSAPKGYEKMSPQKIQVTADSNPVIEAVNTLKKGILIIEKRDADHSDKKLSGAGFEVMNQETKEKFFLTTDENGRAVSEPLITGRSDQGGIWKPYKYEVKETIPPKTYQLNPVKYVFTFEDNTEESKLTYTLTVPNEPTKIKITKSDFNSGLLLRGASLAVYDTKIVNGYYEADGAAIEEWISSGQAHTIEGKMTAGRVYMLKELKAPAGYNAAKPVIFTLSEDGRRIVNVTDYLHIVRFETSGSYIDAIESVTVSGRLAERTIRQFTDLDTGNVIRVPAGKEELTAEDGLVEGHRYEEQEFTCYTDGSEQADRRTIFYLNFDPEGTYRITSRYPDQTLLRIETEGGEIIEEWPVENKGNNGYCHTIFNPEYEDGQDIRVTSSNGRFGAGVHKGSIVTYEITCRNDENEKKNIKINAILDPQLEYMPANSTADGKVLDQTVTWVMKDILPGECGSIKVVAAVKEDAQNKILTTAFIDGKEYTCQNPIVPEGSLTVACLISGTAGEELEKREFEYEINLRDADNEPLKGVCHYTGSKEGTIKSGDTISLKGGEFITITDMAWGTHYEVKVRAQEDVELSQTGTKGMTGKKGASGLFFLKKNDSSVREIFKKGDRYLLTETTIYSDGSNVISNRLSFTLNETASVDGIDMKDRPTHVEILKTDLTGGTPLEGAHLLIKDKSGKLVKEWNSTTQPEELIALLEPGETYFLMEAFPPPGFAYARAIEFTVSDDGTIDHILMGDPVTQVEIIKTNESGEDNLAGALLEICDEEGKLIEQWISDGNPHILAGKLKAGAVYTLAERKSPSGYWKTGSVEFRVPEDGTLIQVELKNKQTRIYIEKRGYSADETTDFGMIGGAEIAIYDRTGKQVYQFTTKHGILHEITGILCAGETYTAVELRAPEGYLFCEPVVFTVPEYSEYESPEGVIMPVIVKLLDVKKPDSQNPTSPDRPSRPEVIKPLTFGTITVQYEKNIAGTGTAVIKEGELTKIPWLGDISHNLNKKTVFCLLLIFVLILVISRRKK